MDKTKRLLIVLIFALSFIGGIVYLRVNKIIESSDFTLLIISIMVGSFVIIFFEKISEISIVGNTVKLERINEKSEELLKQLRIEHLKLKIDSAFGATNFFGGGDSVSSCRAKLFEVANDIKEAGLLDNDELKNKILPLLISHAGFHLKLIQGYGFGLEENPLKSLSDPQEIREAISDQILDASKISEASSRVDKMLVILSNIEIYQNLLIARKWFDE